MIGRELCSELSPLPKNASVVVTKEETFSNRLHSNSSIHELEREREKRY